MLWFLVFPEAIPLCLFHNKLHLLCVTQQKCILSQIFYFHMCATCFSLYYNKLVLC